MTLYKSQQQFDSAVEAAQQHLDTTQLVISLLNIAKKQADKTFNLDEESILKLAQFTLTGRTGRTVHTKLMNKTITTDKAVELLRRALFKKCTEQVNASIE